MALLRDDRNSDTFQADKLFSLFISDCVYPSENIAGQTSGSLESKYLKENVK
jgi:hypothetical protein